MQLNRISKETPFRIASDLLITPIEVSHFRMPVLGFRIGDFTYITDAKTVSDEERAKIRGSKILIVNALRLEEHVSHFNLEEALIFIEEMNPERAYLTHVSHLFAKHVDIEKMLPNNVSVAWDGMTFEV